MPTAETLPDLRFVAVESLVPHERHDAQRSGPLMRRIREQGMLRNPPAVAALDRDGTRFVVLDGANRATAVREAGLPHIVVQVVRYDDPALRLTTWHHALGGFPVPELERALAGIAGLEARAGDLAHARAVLARREAIAFVALPGDRALTLHGDGDLHGRNDLLNAVVDLYRASTRFHRVTGDALEEARAVHPEVTALIVFPHFEPAEVIELAKTGARLPAGITRHLIPGRALRVNVPLERMADPHASLADKQRWLADWLAEKVANRQVRAYPEPTVLFDE